MELVNYGLFSSMAYNAATVVASILHARSLVLIHSTHSKDADLKIKLITQYIMIQGHLEKCFSTPCFFWYLKMEQGDILLKMGPVGQEIFSGPAPGKGKNEDLPI